MQRHELHLGSLIVGLLLVALSVAYVIGAYTDLRLDGRILWPAALVVLGVAGLAGSIRAQRLTDASLPAEPPR